MKRICGSIVALMLAATPAFAGAPSSPAGSQPEKPVSQVPAGQPLPSPVLDLTSIGRDRLSLPGVSDALLGALAYLENTQIRNRPGKGHCAVDASDEGDGCRNEIMLNLPFAELRALDAPPVIKARNRAGEWASYVHFLPKKTGLLGRTLVSVQDSNLFMTAFIGYPLFLFDESFLPVERRSIEPMLDLALKNVLSFKRGDAYNFWAVLPGVDGAAPRTGPFNIPVAMVRTMGKMFLNPKFASFFAMLTKGQKAPPPASTGRRTRPAPTRCSTSRTMRTTPPSPLHSRRCMQNGIRERLSSLISMRLPGSPCSATLAVTGMTAETSGVERKPAPS